MPELFNLFIRMPPNFPDPWTDPRPLPSGDHSGQAATWLVRSTEDGRDYVAKVVRDLRPERRARFKQEIQTCLALGEHPNIAQIVSTGETTNSHTPFFVMPWYSLGSLENERARLNNQWRTFGTPLEILDLFLQICKGVAYAHGKQIVHRDLKPANIFLDNVHGKRTAVVGDFGLCYRHEEHAGVTQPWELVGARMYMAPEWRDGPVEHPHPSGDVYALGKILYWMCGGQTRDREECVTRPELRLRTLIDSGEYRDPADHSFVFIDELLAKAVIENPARRLQTAGYLRDEVQKTIFLCATHGRALDLTLKHRCAFCRRGHYRVMATPEGQGQWSEGWQFQLMAVNGGGQIRPLILVCDECGDVRLLRPDLSTPKSGGWKYS